MPAVLNPTSLPLRDIHLPPAISWWPPAPGWWLLPLAVTVLLAVIYGLQQHHRHRHFRRLALQQLKEIERQYLAGADARRLQQDLSRLLRQTALLHFPENNCAGLVGNAWLKFLDQRLEGAPFTEGLGQLLAKGPYLPQSDEFDARGLLDLCRTWLLRLPPAPKPRRRQR